jgi:hypothetical protein
MEGKALRGATKRPTENGWMPLAKWAEMTETSWTKALAFASTKSKRSGKMFDPRDVDRRSNQDIHVWYQSPNPVTGFRRPRFVDRPNPSNGDSTGSLHTSGESPLTPSHGQATAESPRRSARSSHPESSGAGAEW